MILYRIVDIVPVRGRPPIGLRNGWSVMRVESPNPISNTELMHVNSSVTIFDGVTEELHYTGTRQREELEQLSRPEIEPSDETNAVLIPLAKSAEWWKLGQDERQVHFKQTQDSEGHTVIGLRYVDRVYRRLYHSRHLPNRSEYDFLTYFEFHEADVSAFRALLAELRDPILNPEWRYVTQESEVTMKKIA